MDLGNLASNLKVGKDAYLVAPVSDDLLDALITAAGRIENDEENGDREPSIGNDRDLESDGLEDEALNWGREGGEMTLGWANEGSQEHLQGSADESEPSLGWNDGGMHLWLTAGYSGGTIRESDGNCDDEPDVDDEPDHEDDGVIDGDGSTPWSAAI